MSLPLLRTSSLKAATLPPFRSFKVCPHDPLVDGDAESDDEDEDDDDDVDEGESSTSTAMDASSSSSSSSQDPFSSASSYVDEHKEQMKKEAEIKREAKKKKKKNKNVPKTPAQVLAEEQRLLKEEGEITAKWTVYNSKLFGLLPKFTSLDTIGLNLIGNSAEWDVSGFKYLTNLRVIEIEVDNDFAQQMSDIIEFARDVPYRHLQHLQSNSLFTRHLQQLLRPRHPSDPNQDDPPCWQNLHSFKVFGRPPQFERNELIRRWERLHDERFVIPYLNRRPDEDEKDFKKRVKGQKQNKQLNIYIYAKLVFTPLLTSSHRLACIFRSDLTSCYCSSR